MSFNPKTRLVYIPAREIGWIWDTSTPTWFYEGYALAKLTAEDVRRQTRGILLAWDPIANKAAWTVPQNTLSNGGTLTTAGGLVAQGSEDGYIRFHDASNGKLLHEILVGTGIIAPPISYAVAGGDAVRVAERRPVQPFYTDDTPQPAARIAAGAPLYFARCSICHGVAGEAGVIPDLRRMSTGSYAAFDSIVRGGLLRASGMASFADVLSADDVENIRSYIVDWAQRSRREINAE